MTFWRKLFSYKKEEPLRGAPDVRRLKTYSANNGFVYLYSFSGMRVTHRDGEVGTEYVFAATSDRKRWWSARVILVHSLLNSWMRYHAKDLSASERYGIAKISLLQLFDSMDISGAAEEVVTIPDKDALDTIAEVLDLL